jgi:hypothetical protein
MMTAQTSLQGEAGYYLTVFEAALDYIANFDFNAHCKELDGPAKRRG